jgi:hypothetical protein
MAFSPSSRVFVESPAAISNLINVDLLTGTVNGLFDTINFQSVNFEIVNSAGLSGGGVIFEQTNDSTGSSPMQPIYMSRGDLSAGLFATASSTPNVTFLFAASLQCRYIRLRRGSAVTAGSQIVRAVFSQESYAPTQQTISSGSALAVGVGTSASTGAQGWVGFSIATNAGSSIPVKFISAAGINAINVKASIANLYSYYFANETATTKYLRLYDSAITPVSGSTPFLIVPLFSKIPAVLASPLAQRFSTGLAFQVTGGPGNADATPIAANDVIGYLTYS